MAYSFANSFSAVEQDGNGGQRSLSFGISTVVPTKPAFCGLGSATTSFVAISLGSITTPKSYTVVNDGAVEVSISTDGGSTTAFTLGTATSTTKQNWCSFGNAGTAPQIKSASSTAAYRTLIVE